MPARGIAMNNRSYFGRGLVVIALALAVSPLAGAAGPEQEAGAPTRAEFTRLQNEVKEQRALIIQLMQADQQRYDMLLRLMQGQGGGPAALAPAAPAAGETAA